MIFDALNGVEEQTLRLLEVCRARHADPDLHQQADREVREPLVLLDEIREDLAMTPAPMISLDTCMGPAFGGVVDVAHGGCARSGNSATVPTIPSRSSRNSIALDAGERLSVVGLQQARDEIELVSMASEPFERDGLPGQQRRCASVRRSDNFGARCSMRSSIWRSAPRRRGPGCWVEPTAP